MLTFKMVSPLTGRVMDCADSAVPYLRKAGWQDAPQDPVARIFTVKVAKVSMRDDHLASEYRKGDYAYRRITQ